jgi:hypothetical protein
MKRVALLAVLAAGLAAAAPVGVQAAKNPCAEHGYLNYTRTDGTTFRNTGECTVYVVHGGTLVPVNKATVVVNSANLNSGLLVFTFSASHFTPGSQLTLLHYVSAPYALDLVDSSAPLFTVAPDGTLTITVGTTVPLACVAGAPLAVTVSDAAGDSATGSGTIACS